MGRADTAQRGRAGLVTSALLLGVGGLGVLTWGVGGLSATHAATLPAAEPTPPDAGLDCLPTRDVDLVALLRAQPFSNTRDSDGRAGAGAMMPITRGSPRWMSGFNAVLAWENDDCPAFAAFAQHMGYEASEVRDRRTGTRHWVLQEPTGRVGRYNGLFVLRAPAERDGARPIVISAPARGVDVSDDGPAQLYLATGAVAMLQNSAHPCSLAQCGGCIIGRSAVCGECTRASDMQQSVDHLQFALFAAMVATRRDLQFEYHGLPSSTPLAAGCRAGAQITQGPLPVPTDVARDTTIAGRFWHALEARLGPACVCSQQDEKGCQPAGGESIFARLANEVPTRPFDPCAQPASRLSDRYIHYAGRGVPLGQLAGALMQAVPVATLPVPPPQQRPIAK